MSRLEARFGYTLPLGAVLLFSGLVERCRPVTTRKVTLACVEIGYKVKVEEELYHLVMDKF